ncbi:hypothetical protein H8E88_13650 [candidate division KSB1 bacterium]|nr:hypothetical protein [candidate division KSB1 bacterium]MBL7095072.1 hypothetical protein [candidate division KSB1 bacterium]
MQKRRNFTGMILTLFLLLILTNTTNAQYWRERVLEQSFEKQDFFFTPNYLNPYGLGNFDKVTPGLLDDPMLNLIINPANTYSDTTKNTYLYMDFRSAHNINENQGYAYPMYGYADMRVQSSSYYYPFHYSESRKALMPVFSGAFLTRPFKKFGKGLSLGLTYQVVMQDDDYYTVPSDIYRSNIGQDYSGNRTADESSIPIVDKYSGEDKMHQLGHFLTFFTGYDFSSILQLGLKINRTIVDSDGAFGSQNLWDSYSRADYTSFWHNMESRDQKYDHWDVAGGIKFNLNKQTSFGITAGYLWGDVRQNMANVDSSLYHHGEVNVTEDWSLYQKSGASAKDWFHKGKDYYGGVDLSHKLDDSKTFRFYYLYNKQDVDISVSANVRDTSYSNYSYEGTNYFYKSESDYALTDIRTGTGNSEVKTHRFMGALLWKIDEKKKISFGVNVELQDRNTITEEDVFSNRHYQDYYRSEYDPNGSKSYESTIEDKMLNWQLSAKATHIRIPFIFNWQVSKSVELMFGLNRKMSSWEIDDVTLAIFNYREQTKDSTTVKKTNFGERYTQPQERRSDIETSVLAGLTIAPTKFFNIRFLVMPSFRDAYDGSELSELRWWIGVNLFP